MGVDFKGSAIAEVNVKAVEFYTEVFREIDKVGSFVCSVTFAGVQLSRQQRSFNFTTLAAFPNTQ